MQTTFVTIGIAVAASLLVLLILGIGRIVWHWFLAEVWLKFTYRHVMNIAGEWLSEYTDANKIAIVEELKLKQYGWKVKGRFKYTATRPDNIVDSKQFELEGIIRNDHLAAFYWNEDRKQKGCGSLTLAIKGQGDILEGKFAWYDVVMSKVDAGDYEMRRKT